MAKGVTNSLSIILKQLGVVSALIALLCACGDKAPEPEEYHWPLPAGISAPAVPADNPMSEAKVTLGRYLFYDRGLSGNGRQSCADCHQQQYAFAEPKVVSIGSEGEAHSRNSLALVNVAFNSSLTWADHGLIHIEKQLLLPLFGLEPLEMGITGQEDKVLACFARSPYPELFQQAFVTPQPSFDHIVKALASFVRSLVSFDSPFDRYAYHGEGGAMSPQAARGLALFMSERLECHHCHGGLNLSQSVSHGDTAAVVSPFHNTGLYNLNNTGDYPAHDRGLLGVTQRTGDMGKFRAPTLRNIALTAPYMHDGSVATLSEVVDIYSAGGRVLEQGVFRGDGRQNPHKSEFIKGFEFTEVEKQELLAFFDSLTDPGFVTNPRYGNPWREQ